MHCSGLLPFVAHRLHASDNSAMVRFELCCAILTNDPVSEVFVREGSELRKSAAIVVVVTQ